MQNADEVDSVTLPPVVSPVVGTNVGTSRAAATVVCVTTTAAIAAVQFMPRYWLGSLGHAWAPYDPLAQTLVYQCADLVFVVLFTFILILGRMLPCSSLGISFHRLGRQLLHALWAVLLMSSAFVLIFALYWISRSLVADRTGGTSLAQLIAADAHMRAPFVHFRLLTATLAVAATKEELLFRGLLLSSIAGITRDRWSAIVVSALAFGAAHLLVSPANALAATWMGLVLGHFYVKNGKLLTVVVAHFVFNFSAAVLTYVTA